MNALTDLAYDLIFPPRCPYCGSLIEKNLQMCGACSRAMKCRFHSDRLENGVSCVSAYRYDGGFRKAILDYKYHNRRQYCKPFAITLAEVIQELLSDEQFDIYTSVPAYRTFSLSRFDHAACFTRRTARLFGVEYRKLLVRTQIKTYQHSLGTTYRTYNVKEVYDIRPGQQIEGKSILLFDDVITTGTTLSCCSQLLLDAGAKRVVCITLFW